MIVLDTILLGVDGSQQSDCAAEFAASLASRLGAEVVVVHAVGLLDVWPDHPESSHERNSHTMVREALEGPWTAPFRQTGVQHRLLLRDGPPSIVLLDVADEIGADLIVVGSRGAGQTELYALGSTSTKITQQAKCPVVVVPEIAAPEAVADTRPESGSMP